MYSAVTYPFGRQSILIKRLNRVTGILPLAIGLSEGSEMLQSFAIVIEFGLSLTRQVLLLMISSFYLMIHKKGVIS